MTLSFPPSRRGVRDNLTWPRFTAAILLLGLLLFIMRSTT
jgi:hypothetical protein